MLNNLSSDDLRRQLGENNAAMNTLAEDNQEIVELLSQRGLQAINYSSDLAEIRLLLERRADVPLTAKELKAGGWYLKEVTQSSWDALELYGFESYSDFACKDIGLRFCGAPWAGFALNPSGNVARFSHKKDLSGLKQIHRRGNRFYWGAPNG